MRRTIATSACALLLLGILAGPALAAPHNKNTIIDTLVCDDISLTITMVLHSGGVTSHVVDSTQRLVGKSVSGTVYLDGDFYRSFDYSAGRDPHGLAMTCPYTIEWVGADGVTVKVVGVQTAFLTPAKR